MSDEDRPKGVMTIDEVVEEVFRKQISPNVRKIFLGETAAVHGVISYVTPGLMPGGMVLILMDSAVWEKVVRPTLEKEMKCTEGGE